MGLAAATPPVAMAAGKLEKAEGVKTVDGDERVLRNACGRISPGWVLATAWLGYFAVYIGRKPLAVSKKNLSDTLGFTPGQLAGLDTAFLAAYTCGSFAGGLLGDKHGERVVLTVVLAGSSIACALFALSRSPHCLAVAWALNGVMQGVPYPCYMKLLATSFGDRLGSAAGIWQSSAYVGGGIGNLLAGALITNLDWPAAFWVPSVFLMIMSTVTYFVTPIFKDTSAKRQSPKVPERPHDQKELKELAITPAGETSETGEVRQRFVDETPPGVSDGGASNFSLPEKGLPHRGPCMTFCGKARSVIMIPALVEVSTAYFLVKLVRYALLFWLPFYLVNERKYSPAVAGPMASCFELGGLIGCPLAGLATDKLARGHRFRVVMPFLVCTAAFLFLYADASVIFGLGINRDALQGIVLEPSGIATGDSSGWSSVTSVAFDAFVLSFLGIFISGPDSIFAGPAAQDIGRNSGGVVGPATIVGLVDGLGSLGSVLQGSVTALVTATYGWAAMFRLSACLLLVSCVLCIRPRRVEAYRLQLQSGTSGHIEV
jgi:sugar phosphate permease